jgi:hypothetical protein
MGAMAEGTRALYVGRRYRLYPTREQAGALRQALLSARASAGPDADAGSYALTPGEAPVITPDARGWAAVSVPDVGDVRLRIRRPLRGTVRSGSLMWGRFGWHLGLVIEFERSPAAPRTRPALRLVRRDDSRR